MSNLHRIRWIDEQIRAGRFPNCRTIVERFEISGRQASRDVEYLRYSMGAPIEYSAERNGYFYSDAAYALPQQYISEEQKRNLKFLADQYRALDNAQAVKLAELFSRLTGYEQVSGRISSLLPVYDVDPRVIDTYHLLEKAIKAHTAVHIQYINYDGEKTSRLFHPYKLFSRKGQNYVVGFCMVREDIRILKLNRIAGMEPSEHVFSVSPHFNESDYNEDIHFNYKTPFVSTIEAEGPIDFGRLKVSAQQKQHARYTYTVEFFNSEELLRLLLSSSGSFSVTTPGWLREKLKARLQRILERNI